ncbi:glycosyltransferase, partial [Campylobacter coli]
VMTSYFESFGMVLIESANYNIPSISFDIYSGPKEIIENKKSGYCFRYVFTKKIFGKSFRKK